MRHIIGKCEERLRTKLNCFLMKGNLRALIYAAGD